MMKNILNNYDLSNYASHLSTVSGDLMKTIDTSNILPGLLDVSGYGEKKQLPIDLVHNFFVKQEICSTPPFQDGDTHTLSIFLLDEWDFLSQIDFGLDGVVDVYLSEGTDIDNFPPQYLRSIQLLAVSLGVKVHTIQSSVNGYDSSVPVVFWQA